MNQTPGVQTSPGQFQPAYTQAPPGQSFPASTPQGQPAQYYVQPGQQAQPGPTTGQPVFLVQPAQPRRQRKQATPRTTIYWKSALDASRLIEFLMLMATWICIVMYSNRVFESDGRASFFKGITVFCWVMIIIFHTAFLFVFHKAKHLFSRPSQFTVICLVVQIILTVLLIACTAYIMPLAHEKTKWYDNFLSQKGKTTLVNLYLSLIFGVYSCICFLDDVYYLYKMIGTQKAEEQKNTEQTTQQPGTGQQQLVGAVTKPIEAEGGLESQM